MQFMKKENKEKITSLLGQCIKNRRTLLNISQEELAIKSGLHRTYIGDIECGKRNVSIINIVRIASALDIALSELLKPFGNMSFN